MTPVSLVDTQTRKLSHMYTPHQEVASTQFNASYYKTNVKDSDGEGHNEGKQTNMYCIDYNTNQNSFDDPVDNLKLQTVDGDVSNNVKNSLARYREQDTQVGKSSLNRANAPLNSTDFISRCSI